MQTICIGRRPETASQVSDSGKTIPTGRRAHKRMAVFVLELSLSLFFVVCGGDKGGRKKKKRIFDLFQNTRDLCTIGLKAAKSRFLIKNHPAIFAHCFLPKSNPSPSLFEVLLLYASPRGQIVAAFGLSESRSTKPWKPQKK